MAGIEVLLKRVASKVSNKGGSVGMLRQMKDFNSFLERAALVLESRKVWTLYKTDSDTHINDLMIYVTALLRSCCLRKKIPDYDGAVADK